jgi:hypothetical protein
VHIYRTAQSWYSNKSLCQHNAILKFKLDKRYTPLHNK